MVTLAAHVAAHPEKFHNAWPVIVAVCIVALGAAIDKYVLFRRD